MYSSHKNHTLQIRHVIFGGNTWCFENRHHKHHQNTGCSRQKQCEFSKYARFTQLFIYCKMPWKTVYVIPPTYILYRGPTLIWVWPQLTLSVLNAFIKNCIQFYINFVTFKYHFENYSQDLKHTTNLKLTLDLGI